MAYLKASTWPLLDSLHFAYRANKSVDDAVNMGLHFILQHLDRPGTYVRILFVDFSSAFNTIIPDSLHSSPSPPPSVSGSPASWQTGSRAPQGCVLSPLLFSLYTNDCTSKDPSVTLLKFADNTTLIGLIQNGDGSAYRQEVKELAVWCSLNDLELNTQNCGDDSFASWGSSTCHRSCWYSSTLPSLNPSSARQPLSLNCTHPEWAKELAKSLWTLTSSTLSLWTVPVWSTLQSSEHHKDQTQKQSLPSGNPSHEHLTLNTEHTTLLYNYLFTTHLFFHFKFSRQTLHIIVCIVHCVFAILYIVPVILLHCGASVTITNSSYAWTYLVKKVHSDSDSNNITIFYQFSTKLKWSMDCV